MLVHKGGKIRSWGGECRDVTPTKSAVSKYQGRCEQRSEVFCENFVKIQFFFFSFFFFWGEGQVRGMFGGGESQGGCEQRIEVFVGGGGRGAGSGWGVRVDVNEKLKFL